MKHTVENEDNLLNILSKMFPQSSNSKLRKMLTEGRVNVDGTLIYKAKATLQKGNQIKIIDRAEAIKKSPHPKGEKHSSKLLILHEDNEILVVVKPAGLLSVATNKLENDTLHSRCVDYLKNKSKRAWCHIVHRLDRETSGIMVLAKEAESKNHLQSQFVTRSVERIYHALVEGKPSGTEGTDKSWIYEDKNLNVKRVKSSFRGAREAITHWQFEDEKESYSLLKINIETGRRHQIRMAMKNLGCPVVGDFLHGANTNPFNRICLHASALSFNHPRTNENVRFESLAPF